MSISSAGAPRKLGLLSSRPAVSMAVALMVGIAFFRRFPHLEPRHAWIPASVLLAGFVLRRAAVLSAVLLLTSVVICGAWLAQLDRFGYASNHISQYSSDTMKLAQIELYIIDPPRTLGSFGQFRQLPPKQVTTARATKILTWDGWAATQGEILVQLEQPHPRLRAGQTVRVLGLLQRPSPAMNPGQFDWESYYRDQRICASIQIPRVENVEILAEPRFGLITWLREKTRTLLGLGFTLEQSLDHALLRALLLGDNDPELRDVQEDFRKSGTSHHLAVSGAHIAVLGGFVFGICRLLLLSPQRRTVLTLFCVVFYGIVALPSPPVVRSVLLCAGVALGLIGRRQGDMVQLMAVSAICMLVYHPMDLFNAGFQLSFGTVLGMILLSRPVESWFFNPDDSHVGWQSNFAGFRTRLKMSAKKALVVGAVAWMVSLPMIALHFEQLNPWAIPAGIVLAPIVVVALIAGQLKIVLSLLFPSASSQWALAVLQPIRFMRWTVDWLASWPGSEIALPAPPVWLVIVYYLLLLLAFVPLQSTKWQKRIRFAPVLGILLILIIPLRDGIARARSLVTGFEMTLLSVGAGQCLVVEPPNSPAVIIDCGSTSLGDDLLRKCLAPFLRHKGRREIDRIILTHSDYDHISATADTVSMYSTRQVLIGPHLRAQASQSAPAEDLLAMLDRVDRTPSVLSRGQSIDLGGGAVLEVLWPPLKGEFSTNNGALVMKIKYAGRSILLPADIQDIAMRGLLEHRELLRADVLVAPHHGSMEDTTPEFIKAIDAKYIISSNDRTLSQKQVQFDRLVAGTPLYRTHRDGAITVSISRSGTLNIETFRK